MDDLKKLIREVPDFPKPGINFYDITTLLKHPEGLRKTVDALAAQYEGAQIDTVVGIEAPPPALNLDVKPYVALNSTAVPIMSEKASLRAPDSLR